MNNSLSDKILLNFPFPVLSFTQEGKCFASGKAIGIRMIKNSETLADMSAS